ncbi:MAG: arginyltransferase [Gemmataceae bacterium]
MRSGVRIQSPLETCAYLPQRASRMLYDYVLELQPAEYEVLLREGWRRFGRVVFRPNCPGCWACQSLRVRVREFQPDRSQRRTWRANAGKVRVEIGVPSLTREKLDLYDRHHSFRSETRGWMPQPAGDAAAYVNTFVRNPFPTQEWCYYLGQRLVGVGYVDRLPQALSAIYFFYDPDMRRLGLGTFNILQMIAYAAQAEIPYVYLGYYVAGCKSLAYKANFCPNEILYPDGAWRMFRTRRVADSPPLSLPMWQEKDAGSHSSCPQDDKESCQDQVQPA